MTRPVDNYARENEMFNRGVQHAINCFAKKLGVDDWEDGDGSEDYDEDLTQTLLNILEARGIYDPETGLLGFAETPRLAQTLRLDLLAAKNAVQDEVGSKLCHRGEDGIRRCFRLALDTNICFCEEAARAALCSQAPIDAALAPGNAGAPWPADTNEGREAVASYIYDAFPFDGPPHKTKPAWIPHGNSDWQDKARETADTIINLLRPGNAGAVEAWQPMETAPKDGTEILAYWGPKVDGGDNCIDTTIWHEWKWTDPEDTDTEYAAPTHWMPLPAAPLPATQGDGE